jgi:hypothetical protein
MLGAGLGDGAGLRGELVRIDERIDLRPEHFRKGREHRSPGPKSELDDGLNVLIPNLSDRKVHT